MDKRELEQRTKQFALRVIQFVAVLPKNSVTNVMGYQLVKLALPSEPIIARPIEPNHVTTSSTK